MHKERFKIIRYLCEFCALRFEDSGGAKRVTETSNGQTFSCCQEFTTTTKMVDGFEVTETVETTMKDRPGGPCSRMPTYPYKLRI